MRRFSFFKPHERLDIRWRNLPHWEQPDVCYFLTFRTADSLPRNVMDDWERERRDWLAARGIDVELEDWHAALVGLSAEDVKHFHSHFSARMHELLDAGHGACELKKEVIRQVVVDALRHFNESRYLLGGLVVMPNHVHVLVQCLGETRLKPMCASWKRFTARRINEFLSQTGHFWQGETYDHIVRSQRECLHYRDYIRQNPVKARLKEGEYSLFLPEVAE